AGERDGEAHGRSLCGRICGGGRRVRTDGRDGREVDDGAALSRRDHRRRAGLGSHCHAAYVHNEVVVPLVRGNLAQALTRRDADVVLENVQLAVELHGGLHHAVAFSRRGDITDEGGGGEAFRGDYVDCFLCALFDDVD